MKFARSIPRVLSLSALLALPSWAFNPYGVVTDGSRSEYDMHGDLADLIKVGGMGYERVDWDWRACQREKDGAFDFSRYDKIVEADEARGVTVLPIVYGPPSWAYPAWQHLDGYAAFVRETVRRYGKRMPVIEIWNEQNIVAFWKNPNPTNYLALLKVAYTAAKEVDPSVRVALGGTAGWAHGFIRSLYAIGAKDFFDIVNVHPYCYPYPPEEPLRKGFEELRKIMAEYGDAQKPIWFTEIGWPTHEVDLTGPGNVLLAGLKTARPEKTSWNVICAVCKPDGEMPDQSLAKSLLARLPSGSTVRVCAPKETCERLAEGGWDAVVYPLDESYPADTLDAVVAFVRNGGTLVDLGGMPMWNPYRNLPDGSGRKFPHDGGRERFKRLRIGLDSWWLPGSELPRTDGNPMNVYATSEGLAAGVKQSPNGFPCGHFFTEKALGPNDRMVPLIAGTNPLNGKPAVAACAYLFDGDMKGRVVVCGIQKGSAGSAFPVSEHQQGVMFARAMGISFAEGVEAFFWYSLRARETDRFYNEHHFGMVHANLVPKDGWLANKMFITQRPAGSTNLGGEWRTDGVFFPQWKRPDGKVGGMVWTDRAARELILTFDTDDIAFHDMWGKPAVVYGTGRARQVQVTGEPLYFTGARLLSFSSVGAAKQARGHGSARFQVEMDDGGGFSRKVGETVVVSACVKGTGGNAVNSGTVEAWVDDGWTNVVWRRSVDLAREPVVKMRLSRATPGTLRIYLKMQGVREKMDRVVFGQGEIMPLTPCPEDFEGYWRGELAKLKREVPIAVEKTPAPDLSTAEHDVFRVSFATFNGKRVYGFLAVPKGKGPFPVCVNVPGAGPGVVAPSKMRKGWVNFTMNMHGFPIGRTKKEQKERYDAWLSDLWVRGGEPKYQRFGFAAGRDKPIYHDIVTGMVRALDWLADEPYADASRFVYCGCSQGGGFGIYLTSLWGRFRKSLILCPNMCDMLAYRAGRQPGSEHILQQTPEHQPSAELVAPYYDACNFARLIRTPVRMVYGLSDDNCNTGGGIAAFNALGAADKELRLLPGLGHGWHTAGFDTWLFDL